MILTDTEYLSYWRSLWVKMIQELSFWSVKTIMDGLTQNGVI